MALHGSQSGLLINGFNMAGYFGDFQMEGSQAVHPTTVFGATALGKTPGLKDGKCSGTSFLDDTATVGSLAVLKGLYANAAPGVPTPAYIALALNSPTFALGSRVVLGYFTESSLTAKMAVADMEMLTLAGEANEDAIDFGFSLHAISAETGTGNGTALDNAAATTNGGVGTLHVTAIAGAAPSVVITIEHSTDNSTWVTLVTFVASIAANTSQRIEIAAGTTVRRYLRAVRTFGGTTTSITFQPNFARR